MKKINIIKITLDIIMTLVFVLLYNKMVIAGLAFHEIAGLAIGAIFLIHIGLNYKWVTRVTGNLFNKNIKAKTRIGYVTDLLLLISMAYIIISGIFISRVVFPNLGLGNNAIFKMTHISVSYLALLLIGIHLGLHWDWVMGVFKRILKLNNASRLRSYIAKVLALLIFAFGVYSIYSTGYISRISSFGNVIGISQGQIPEKGMKGSVNGEGRPQFDGKARPERDNGGTAADGRSMPEGKMPQREGGGLPGTNPLNVILTYLGIVSVIVIITYYFEKLLVNIKSMKKQAMY